MTTFTIAIPESLTKQKSELEGTLANITKEEEKLQAQRKDIQVALTTINTGIAVLSGQPIPSAKPTIGPARKPMSEEAKKRIAEGLKKSREAKAAQTNIHAAAEKIANSPAVLSQDAKAVSSVSSAVKDAGATADPKQPEPALKAATTSKPAAAPENSPKAAKK